MTTTTKSLHPLVLAAAVAVLLFCGVGTAALMGWLPSSQSEAPPLSANASAEQLASLQANQPPAGAQPLVALPPPHWWTAQPHRARSIAPAHWGLPGLAQVQQAS